MRGLAVTGLALVLILDATRASAQVTGDVRGWTSDGRAVIEFMASWASCPAGPLDGPPALFGGVCPDCADAAACGLKTPAGKASLTSPDGSLHLVPGKPRCDKEGTCRLEIAVLPAGESKPGPTTPRFVHETAPTGERLVMSLKGTWFRPDSKAVLIDIGHDMPDAKVYEDAIFVVDLSAAHGAAPVCDESKLPKEIIADVDGDGTKDSVRWQKSPFVLAVSVKGKQIYCLNDPPCEKGGGQAQGLRPAIDGKRDALDVHTGCAGAGKGAVLVHEGGRMKKVFEYDSWDAKDVQRMINLLDVDGAGWLEVVVNGFKDLGGGTSENYPGRVVKYDAAAGVYKNDVALTKKLRGE